MFFRTPRSTSNSASFTGLRSYSFNGKEKDDEWNGTAGAALDFGARIFDSRLGKFLSVDQFMTDFPGMSNYSFARNNPIYNLDINGNYGVEVTKAAQEAGVDKTSISTFVTVVANMSNLFVQQPELYSKLNEITGVDEATIKAWMVYGEGPTISIQPEEFAGATVHGSGNSAENMPLFISIDPGFITTMAEKLNDPLITDEEKATIGMSFALLIIDETAHYGDRYFNQTSEGTGDPYNGTKKPGKQKMKWADPAGGYHRGGDAKKKIIGADIPSATGPSIVGNTTQKWTWTDEDFKTVKDNLKVTTYKINGKEAKKYNNPGKWTYDNVIKNLLAPVDNAVDKVKWKSE